jgi:hypothetical protein
VTIIESSQSTQPTSVLVILEPDPKKQRPDTGDHFKAHADVAESFPESPIDLLSVGSFRDPDAAARTAELAQLVTPGTAVLLLTADPLQRIVRREQGFLTVTLDNGTTVLGPNIGYAWSELKKLGTVSSIPLPADPSQHDGRLYPAVAAYTLQYGLANIAGTHQFDAREIPETARGVAREIAGVGAI